MREKISGIRDELISSGKVTAVPKVTVHSDTRQYRAELTFANFLHQREFLHELWSCDQYQQYYDSRTASERFAREIGD